MSLNQDSTIYLLQTNWGVDLVVLNLKGEVVTKIDLESLVGKSTVFSLGDTCILNGMIFVVADKYLIAISSLEHVRILTLLTGLEYPKGLWVKDGKVWLTETAGARAIRKAPVMPIFEPGGFTRENREMGGLGIY
jgi:hypothetical protein